MKRGVMGALSALGCAGAADLYVATNGLDSGARDRWSTAYTNLQDALTAATHHDTIYLAGHFFALTNQAVWNGLTNVSIKGGYAATNDSPLPGSRNGDLWPTVIARVTNDSRVLYIGGVTNGLIEGVTLTGGQTGNNGGYNYSAGLHIATSRVALVSCIITNNRSIGRGGFGGALYINASSVVGLTNCIIRRNTLEAIGGNWGSHGGGIYSAGTLTMTDCVLADNLNSISSAGNEWGGGLYVNSGTALLRNCRVTGNRATDGSDGIHLAGGTLSLENCTVAFNGRQGINRAAGTAAATNCILWGNVDDLVGTISLGYCAVEDGDDAGTNGNFSADPLLEFGYYLSPTSPCVNAGTGGAGLTGGGYTTHTNGAADTGAVDLGYHHSAGYDTSFAHLYVATNGNDIHVGTNPALPVRTLARALSQARDGSWIHVGAGTYTNGPEVFPVLVQNVDALRIEGAGADQTVFSAAGVTTRVWQVKGVNNGWIGGIGLSGGVVPVVGTAIAGDYGSMTAR